MNTNELKSAIWSYIDEKADLICDVSEKLWGFAELSLREYRSCELFCEVLKAEGFQVEKGICGIDTAFSASVGNGSPRIALLAEYDALSGLSQECGNPVKKPVEKGGAGHGCGHNLLGSGSLAAALAMKKYLELTGFGGTVTLVGCPGEEGGASKAFMARDGYWKEFDAAVTWHPFDASSVPVGTCNSSIEIIYSFNGTAAHAAGNPEDGRSALDAVELMNVGVQYLREHVPTDARMHYAMLDGGGVSPNVVQPTASVLYMIRSVKVKDALKLVDRVDKIAEGASLMTGTTFEKKFIDGTSNCVGNSVLEDVAQKNLEQAPMPTYTDEELTFAKAIYDTLDHEDYVPGEASRFDDDIRNYAMEKSENGKKLMNDFVLPLCKMNLFSPGSTDVGDVSWLTPTVQIYTACFVSGTPTHSWQAVAVGGTSLAEKGMLQAGKAMAGIVVDLLESPDILQKAKEEFSIRTADGFTSPIPEGALPLTV